MEQRLLSLDGVWQLTLAEHESVESAGFDPHTVAELQGAAYPTIPASVPGNFELDMHAANLAPDPFFGTNAWDFQQYENRHLWYSTTFDSPTAGDANTYLVFNGIDTVADIYLNGTFLGHTENMLIAHEFQVSGLKPTGNELLVHIHPATVYARRYEIKPMHTASIYGTSSLPLRKVPSMYGWDIMPRFVSGGIWKSVTLVQKPAERLEQFYLYTEKTNPARNNAAVAAFFQIQTKRDSLKGLKIVMDAVCGDSRVHTENDVWHTFGTLRHWFSNIKLWYPKNAGEQPLYDVTVKLLRDGVECDRKEFRFGIRSIELIRSSTTDEKGNGEFLFKINDKRVFCMGTNWVPLDAFHSRDVKHLPNALAMLDDVGCNMVRCWGGNAYEDDAFFDFCDEKGIMVWQDFAMGCALYPQDDWFADRLYEEAVAVIRRLRLHPSLVLWAGDNEVDQAYMVFGGPKRDPNFNRLTREVLPRAVREHDVMRPFLPSSPYYDAEAVRTDAPLPEEHLWGPRDYFKGDYYRNSVCHFASETGYHGCPAPLSLAQYLPAEHLWPICGDNGHPHDTWLCHAACQEPGVSVPHAYRITLMMNHVRTMFGTLGETLSEFAKRSQISQGEAKKYFIERFRLSKWRRTGIIWWNLLDGWPQISDAVVDYYGVKKLAYHYIKRSQQPLCMMFDEPNEQGLTLYCVNDAPAGRSLHYTVRDITTDTLLAEGDCAVSADSSEAVITLTPPEGYHFLYIEWQTEDGTRGCNHFATQTRDLCYEAYYKDMCRVGFDTFEGFPE